MTEWGGGLHCAWRTKTGHQGTLLLRSITFWSAPMGIHCYTKASHLPSFRVHALVEGHLELQKEQRWQDWSKSNYLVGARLVPSEMVAQNRLTTSRTPFWSWVETMMGQGCVGSLLDQDCLVIHTSCLLCCLNLNSMRSLQKGLRSLEAFIYSNISSVAMLNKSPSSVFHHYCLLNCCIGWVANLSLSRLPERCRKSLVMVLAWSAHLGT